ncbi:MAG: hypothetical protein RBT69_13225, partial [Spirochaetia bacterium]|nr:hypothetical protein [Spirochaetia bacterium]
MKKRIFLVFIGILLCSLAFAGGTKEKASMEKDYLSMSWDQITAEAKEEGELVFYTWWGEEHWIEAGKEFEKKYGIKTKVIVGDAAANANKVVAEGKQETG